MGDLNTKTTATTSTSATSATSSSIMSRRHAETESSNEGYDIKALTGSQLVSRMNKSLDEAGLVQQTYFVPETA